MSSRPGLKGKQEEAHARGSCLEIWGRFLRVLPQNQETGRFWVGQQGRVAGGVLPATPGSWGFSGL